MQCNVHASLQLYYNHKGMSLQATVSIVFVNQIERILFVIIPNIYIHANLIAGRNSIAREDKQKRRNGLSHHGQRLWRRCPTWNCCQIRVYPRWSPKKNRKDPWEYDKKRYKQRNEIQRFFLRLKRFRRVFSRYDKQDIVFNGFIFLALIFDAILCEHSLIGILPFYEQIKRVKIEYRHHNHHVQ